MAPAGFVTLPRDFRASSARMNHASREKPRDSAADPGAGAGVGPDFAGDPVLFGLRGVLRFALAAVEFPGRRQNLVGAAGAARRVEGAVVAAGLAHHDVGGDRARPAE